jgi:hypothetical protein
MAIEVLMVELPTKSMESLRVEFCVENIAQQLPPAPKLYDWQRGAKKHALADGSFRI